MMKALQHVSTRELLETLKKRGQQGMLFGGEHKTDHEHLKADAEHLLKCLDSQVLSFPFEEVL